MNPADVPVVVLCGGMGTRLREASEKLPKPMVDIGGRPILWHILKVYREHGFRRFVLCLGYKSEDIKRFFLEYRSMTTDFTLDMSRGHARDFHEDGQGEDWEVTFVDTGLLSGTGARIARVAAHLGDAPTFMLTYGDGIGDVDLTEVLRLHLAEGRTGTVTGVRPASRYGEMSVAEQGASVREFNEKPTAADGWVSGGFFAFQREFIDRYLDDDPGLLLEKAPLQRLAADGQLSVHRHEGFWLGMDTYRDWLELNQLWDRGEAAWKTWT